VTAEDDGLDRVHRHAELGGQEAAVAGRVEHAGHADHALLGKADSRLKSVTIASSGFEITITNAFGAWVRMPSATDFMILELVASRSSRLMPGLRARPAVMMQTSAPAMSRSCWCP